MKYRQTHSVEIAAAKASISRATAYSCEKEATPIRLSISSTRGSSSSEGRPGILQVGATSAEPLSILR